jgi:K+-sensing histidine kinase KdpD
MDEANSHHAAAAGPSEQRTAGRPRWPRRGALAVAAGLAGPLALTAVLVPFRSGLANTDAALALILLVVAVAAAGSRAAGYLAAASAAIWFDFFLTRPYERFSISRATDIETTVLLLVIGIAVTEIAVWGRRQQAAASRRSGYLAGIKDAARAAAAGDSPPSLISQVNLTLTQLLALQSCQFQYGVAGLGKPARLEQSGAVTVGGQAWDVRAHGMPASTELLVESGGRLEGRFLMQAQPAAHPSPEQLLVAAAFADQVGAALAASHPVSQ